MLQITNFSKEFFDLKQREHFNAYHRKLLAGHGDTEIIDWHGFVNLINRIEFYQGTINKASIL